ncbi:unnamed protein product [Sphenostylis stenocarpa]|uniref:Legume lectin domain-containing protein n=1 Tax=Sphenostylis stenocarpa TaxID=92480 RepID=A0AA86SVF7_9FABA|nr:unnamed protein product [Sphenostylis stenocarpa]
MASFNFSVVLSLLLLLLTHANATNTFSFTIRNFKSQNLILQRDARISSGTLRLTNVNAAGAPTAFSLGRAFHTTPVQIWDSTTGAIASWATSFTFNIRAPVKTRTADGFAFAMVPPGSKPRTAGGFLGLFTSANYNNSAQTLAVEFDTYSNTWDPLNRHIGIDVNNIRSIKTAPWGLVNGENARVLITYDGTTRLLVASLVHPSSRTSYIISERVNVTKELPEWVNVGFSATTGLSNDFVETHDVLSWSFASKFPDSSSSDAVDLASYVLHEAI